MCRICVEWEKGKLTAKEAFKNIGEVIAEADESTREHLFRLSDKIVDSELPSGDQDEEMDAAWHKETYGDR